ncbi:sugar ABC transporter ATP-binding protein [Nakamurella flavida]|uniref:Sugar ABC transporter ATP-binding protein n=1 Tax=Nakamurella flavida TaxID=363630 RepID=A0A939C4C8_9ACTN|nr:sugar ABC transporter ATP-binding protein [Nakamurella flavida]MBM9475097.1 sugar ABC transporter ATP-binding protein [Nakamurella flavida]MDP9776667.1 ribose transport system ATP-binding protein [Nakamurella flavida]
MSDDVPAPGPGGRALTGSALRKSYAGIEVVKGVDFAIPAGAVVGLIGENGAGKSTLSSMIAGVVLPTSGEMTLDGESYAPTSPSDALDRGVALIHQEIRMVPSLSVAENIFLGRLPVRGGKVDTGSMVRQSREVLDLLGIDLDPRRSVVGLSMAVQQSIEIAKAISRGPKYVIFDEPSASLTGHETDRVLDQIRRMAEHGVGVVYISHRLEEVRDVSSQIICLRDGALVKNWDRGNVPAPEMVSAMVGREFTFEHQAPEPHREDVVLEVRGLGRKGVFSGVDFTVSRGEILGVAGLVGAGRTEMVRTIAGADRYDEGEVLLEGRPVRLDSPAAAIAAGVVMVPEDRKGQGLNLGLSSAVNILQPWEREMGRGRFITNRLLNRAAAKSRADFDIRGSMDLPVVRLSGGNQQKVLLAKWLVHEPTVLILDEPTRGVDVGAKMAIYEIIRDCAARGVAVVVVSSELEEVLGLSHRVMVMSGGRQRGILPRADADAETVMQLAVPTGQQ